MRFMSSKSILWSRRLLMRFVGFQPNERIFANSCRIASWSSATAMRPVDRVSIRSVPTGVRYDGFEVANKPPADSHLPPWCAWAAEGQGGDLDRTSVDLYI